jgi:hypothetical protein
MLIADIPLPHILKLRGAILKIRRNRFHLMGFANQREDDLAFSSEVFGSTSIGDAIDELLGAAHRAGAAAGNFAGSIHGGGHGVIRQTGD